MTTTTAGPDTPWRRLVAASAISNLGDGVYLVAFPLLAATLTTDPATIAAVAMTATVPALLFSLPIGGLVDRVHRGQLMVVVDMVRAALLFLLVGVVVTGVLALWQLFVLAFVLGVGEILFDTASSAYLPGIVEARSLAKANGYLATAAELGNGVIGPAFGGTLFALGAGLPFAADGLSFGLAVLLVVRFAWSRRYGVPAPAPAGAPVAFRAQLAEGLRWLYAHRGLRSVAFVVGAWNLFGWMPEGVLVLYARELGLGATGYGLLFGASSVGAVIGGLVAGRVVDRIGLGPMLLVSVGAYAVLLFPPAFMSDPVAVGAIFLVQGLPLLCWSVASTTARQTLVPDRLLGRVGSVFRLIGGGLAPVGLVLGGMVAELVGVPTVFAVAGAGLTAVFLLNIGGLRELVSLVGPDPGDAARTDEVPLGGAVGSDRP